jgi:surface antigen
LLPRKSFTNILFREKLTIRKPNLSTIVRKTPFGTESLLTLPSVSAARLDVSTRRKFTRWGLIGGNFLLLLGICLFVLTNRSASQTVRSSTINSAVSTASSISNPLDQLSSAQIALQAAQMTRVPELTAVKNQADTEAAMLAVVPSDSMVLAKPQVVETALKSKKDIIKYLTQQGDSITSIADAHHVSANSIRWSNNVTGDAIGSGKTIFIPPAEGIIYQVKSTDTIDSITSKYQAAKDVFVAVNDAESGKLAVGDYVWIPNGVQPAAVTKFASVSTGGFAWGYGPIYASNGYDYGYCTWWAALRRSQIGSPVPSNLGNAITWKNLAAAAGLGVGTRPASGAVIWTPVSYGYGHVGFVERVNPDGSIWVSDMNSHGFASMDQNSGGAGGWGRVSYRYLTPDQAANFWYIY